MIKLSQIIASQESLKSLLELELPVKVAYKIGKLINLMQSDLKVYEEQRVKLVKELGTEDTEKQTFTVSPENLAKFAEELGKLQDIDVPLNFGENKELEKIKISDLGDIQIEPSVLINLDWLLQE